ncbi:MAG TPA: hypothetical protein VKP69_29190 [Isosphaeraceae bacterium]|nr:hypothetical protein [Isosphaeraceae bacterium]
MATTQEKSAGKSMFLKEYLVDHPDAGKEAIAAAWRAAGHAGTISPSLIGQVRRDLGRTGKGTAQGKSRARAATGQRSAADSKSDARGAGPEAGGRAPAQEGSEPVAEGAERPAAAGGDRARALIRLEGALDDLLHEIKVTGGLPECEETLRRARRILVRSHGE